MENSQLPPDKATELQLKKHPEDQNAKVDIGSDYSMDASDPSSASQPGTCNDPAPSSGFPERKPKRSFWSRWKSWLYLTREENRRINA